MTNTEAVLAEASRLASQPGFDRPRLNYKPRLRCPAALAQIRAGLRQCMRGALVFMSGQRD